MKQTVKVALCGVISALAVVVMLGTNIPIMLYAVPALAGILYLVPAIEIGTGWGFLCYIVTAVLSLVLPTEAEALTVFIGILGYYPILKMLIERIGNRILELIIKFAVFNVTIVISYLVIIKIIGINPFSNETLGLTVTALILLAAGNVAFTIYDYAVTMIIKLYFVKLRKHVRKALGIKGRY
jgi:hypothetical protein